MPYWKLRNWGRGCHTKAKQLEQIGREDNMTLTVKSVLVTGANRGIGLELIKQFANLPSPPEFIFAGCRSPESAKELLSLKDVNKNIEVLKIDVRDESTINVAKEKVDDILGDQGLTLLINNAAIFPREQTIEDVTAETLMETFNVNVVGTIRVCKAFLPLVRKASKALSHLPMSSSRAAILFMGGQMGSIADNTTARDYSNRISKCAVNMLTKNLSLELKADNILSVCLHPGWVKTDMGGSGAKITTEECVSGLLNLINGFKEEHNGLFYRYDGGLIPW